MMAAPAPAAPAPLAEAPAKEKPAVPAEDDNLITVNSPMIEHFIDHLAQTKTRL